MPMGGFRGLGMRNLLGILLISASASEGFMHGKAIFSAAGSGMESRGRWAGTCRAPTCGSSHLSDGKAGRNPGCLDFKAVLQDGCFVDSNSFQFGREGILSSMPIWQSSQVSLPGGKMQSIHVSRPELVEMFTSAAKGPGPAWFGHIKGDNRAMPAGGLGTLMEVVNIEKLDDGRIIVKAIGLCKLEIGKQASASPYPRCDCRVLPDEEEIDLYLPEGSAAVMAVVRKKETLGSDVLATVSDGFFGVASRLTATAAAESAALAWSSYEIPRCKWDWAACPNPPRGAEVTASDAVDIANIAVRSRAKCTAMSALSQAGYRPMMREEYGHSDPEGDMVPPSWTGVIEHFEERLREEGVEVDEQPMVDGSDTGAGMKAEGASIRAQDGAAGVTGEAKREARSGAGGRVFEALEPWEDENELEELEKQVWDAALRHAESLNRLAITSGAGAAAGQVSGGKGVYDLPEGLLAMMPERADPEWPPMRRCQRFSFALAPLLADDSLDEALMRSQSIGGRLRILRGSLAIRNGRLTAMLALRDAMGDANRLDGEDDDPESGYPSCTA